MSRRARGRRKPLQGVARDRARRTTPRDRLLESAPAARRHARPLLLLALSVSAVYATSFAAGFPLDNQVLILENPYLRGLGWENVRAILTHDYWHPAATGGVYRPVTSLSYLFNYAVLGNADRAAGYHAINLLLHGACAALVYFLLLGLRRSSIEALLGAALFAAHPIATEAVTNIIGRADLLAALAVLAGLLCHERALATERAAWRIGLGIAAAVGFLSKENAVVVILLVLLWELVAPPLTVAARLRRLAPSLLAAGVALVLAGAVRAWVLAREWPAESSPLDNPILEAGFWSGRATAVKVMGFQLWKLLWPATLSADYSFDQMSLCAWPPEAATLVAMVAIAALIGGALLHGRRHPALGFLVLFYFAALLPTANLLFPIGSIMAERFLYLPLAGFAGAVVVASSELSGARYRRTWVTIMIAVIVACGLRSAARNLDWSSEESIWASAVSASPRSAKAHRGYAAALFAGGEPGSLDRAIDGARRALEIRPDYVLAQIDLARYAIAKGDTTGEPRWYRQSAALLRSARKLDRHANLAFRQRMAARGRSRRETPAHGSPALHLTLGLAQVRVGDFGRAAVAYDYARRLDPWALQTYLDLSAVHANLASWDEAIVTLHQAAVLAPADADVAGRLVQLYAILDPDGRSVVTGSDRQQRIDPRAPLVVAHRCRALVEMRRIFARARLHDFTARLGAAVAADCRVTPPPHA